MELANATLECRGNLISIHFLTVGSFQCRFEDFTYGLCRYDFQMCVTFGMITENFETQFIVLC